jgi:hypothetical protein
MNNLQLEHTIFEAAVLFQSKLEHIGGIRMGKRNKSKRFVQQGVDTVSKHAERIPYHMTYAEAEAQKMANVHESSLGGI